MTRESGSGRSCFGSGEGFLSHTAFGTYSTPNAVHTTFNTTDQHHVYRIELCDPAGRRLERSSRAVSAGTSGRFETASPLAPGSGAEVVRSGKLVVAGSRRRRTSHGPKRDRTGRARAAVAINA
jgi:hypothetical protein